MTVIFLLPWTDDLTLIHQVSVRLICKSVLQGTRTSASSTYFTYAVARPKCPCRGLIPAFPRADMVGITRLWVQCSADIFFFFPLKSVELKPYTHLVQLIIGSSPPGQEGLSRFMLLTVLDASLYHAVYLKLVNSQCQNMLSYWL